jgi:type IV pilus assembly protein PilM
MSSIIGLDIGTHSIKLVEVEKSGNEVTLTAAGSVRAPPKGMESTLKADTEAVAAVIKQLLHDAGAHGKTVQLALPESQVFTRVIEVPQLSQRELTSAIQWEAEQYIPLPLDQVNLDFAVLRDSKVTGTGKMEVLLVAAPKSLIDKYVQVLDYADIAAVSVETEILASSRALTRSAQISKTGMILSIGAQTSDLAIIHGGVLAFVRSISAGGDAMSRALSQEMDIDIAQAEEYKKAYGLETDKLQGKIVTALKPIMDALINEMKRAIVFHQEKHKAERVDTIILNGGTALLPGMVIYIAEAMGIEAQLANPWSGIRRDQRFNVLNTQGPAFSVAVGLALR